MQNSRLRLCALTFIAALALSACSSSDSVDAGDAQEPQGTQVPDGTDSDGSADDVTRPSLAGRWVLSEIEVGGTKLALPPAVDLDMEIEAGRISGNGGCNGFGGTFDVADDGRLTLFELSWTEMGCEPFSILEFENAYLSALSSVDTWEADPDGITLSSDNASMRYVPGEAPVHLALEGTLWTLDTIFSGEGVSRAASSTDQSSAAATLVFADGVATLSTDGCGPLEVAVDYEPGRDGNLAVPEDSDTGADDCGEQNFATVRKALSSASGFMINESRLILIGQPGELVGFRGE